MSTRVDADAQSDATCDPTEHEHVEKPQPAIDPSAFERAARIFRAAGDMERLRLLEHLSHGECCVTELAEALHEGLSTISQRLRLLRVDGMVKRRRERTHIYYSLADEHVAALIANTLAHASEERPESPHDDEKGTDPTDTPKSRPRHRRVGRARP